jgi:integrase
MPKLTNQPPKYAKHKGTGQAVVRLGSRDRYLGRFGSPESYRKYQQVVAEWSTTRDSADLGHVTKRIDRSDLRLCELLLKYLDFAREYYRKDGQPTGELANMKDAIAPVNDLFGDAKVAGFGPSRIKSVREAMIHSGLSRNVVNARINRIRRVFKWGVENELVEPSVLQALQAVAPLKKGRTEAHETPDVKPVPQEHVDAVKATVGPQVRAMIDVQLLTGMRPGELVIMRPRDLDKSKPIWLYRPSSHKTEHHGLSREIFIGPKAQTTLAPFLLRGAESFVFDPREAMLAHQRTRRERSKDPKIRASTKRFRIPRRIGCRYTRKSYHTSIYRACKLAGVPAWGPNRLRHSAATFLREHFGIEAARVILGHTSAAMTEVYAEIDRSKATAIMAQVG